VKNLVQSLFSSLAHISCTTFVYAPMGALFTPLEYGCTVLSAAAAENNTPLLS